ncbi:hypothetical protein [Flavobacterium sp. MK4S-17]|uniref:DUF6932 family protein n=1 Tax=Flavobacterium sp. MK4S-17 TaxID=2543737 RepID=UPI0013589BF5|nr:hypothetical protein [Flavobacterium sp. MK4S-17]
MDEPEYAPLFPAGFHEIEISQFENLFISKFVNKERRKFLIKQLDNFLSELVKVKAKFEIWLDGSFSTYKDEPNDIDILIIFNEKELSELSIEEQSILDVLFDRDIIKIRYNIDVLLCPDDDINRKSYWRGWFGFSRLEAPKGIPRFYYGSN